LELFFSVPIQALAASRIAQMPSMLYIRLTANPENRTTT